MCFSLFYMVLALLGSILFSDVCWNLWFRLIFMVLALLGAMIYFWDLLFFTCVLLLPIQCMQSRAQALHPRTIASSKARHLLNSRHPIACASAASTWILAWSLRRPSNRLASIAHACFPSRWHKVKTAMYKTCIQLMSKKKWFEMFKHFEVFGFKCSNILSNKVFGLRCSNILSHKVFGLKCSNIVITSCSSSSRWPSDSLC